MGLGWDGMRSDSSRGESRPPGARRVCVWDTTDEFGDKAASGVYYNALSCIRSRPPRPAGRLCVRDREGERKKESMRTLVCPCSATTSGRSGVRRDPPGNPPRGCYSSRGRGACHPMPSIHPSLPPSLHPSTHSFIRDRSVDRTSGSSGSSRRRKWF